jgi:hypothetical protein
MLRFFHYYLTMIWLMPNEFLVDSYFWRMATLWAAPAVAFGLLEWLWDHVVVPTFASRKLQTAEGRKKE